MERKRRGVAPAAENDTPTEVPMEQQQQQREGDENEEEAKLKERQKLSEQRRKKATDMMARLQKNFIAVRNRRKEE